MARCPFATFDEITGPVGPFTDGPSKIVHHTTEGSTYAGARSAYAANRSDPHFTVAGADIFQHIDTAMAARSLRNPPGGVETNRDSAVQIEVVGFAGRPKDVATLQSVARLCRWIEGEHAVPQHWPNGQPRASSNGHDPGGHNRDAATWDREGGHYGHSQVPENTHWDPAYTAAELAIVTPGAVFDPHAELGIASRAFDAAAIGTRGRGMSERPDAIVQRVIAGLAAATDTGQVPAAARVTVRVVSDGAEVEVTLEGMATPAVRTKPGAKRLPRRTRARRK